MQVSAWAGVRSRSVRQSLLMSASTAQSNKILDQEIFPSHKPHMNLIHQSEIIAAAEL